MPETPEEMRKRIEEEERIRLEVRRKLEAENRAVGSDRTQQDREAAFLFHSWGLIAMVFGGILIAIGVVTYEWVSWVGYVMAPLGLVLYMAAKAVK